MIFHHALVEVSMRSVFLIFLAVMAFPHAARAEFTINTAILEFTGNGPRQQDIEAVSKSKTNDYLVTEVAEIIHPGEPDEARRIVEDPSDGILLVTPDRSILTAGGRKLLRFVLLKDPDANEHIYRVAIKPVVKGVSNDGKIGLKILIGYEVLVIVRPMVPHISYTAARKGAAFEAENHGNTDILFQNGTQCPLDKKCKMPPVVRIYPGNKVRVDLPQDAPVTYSIWDGTETIEKRFE